MPLKSLAFKSFASILHFAFEFFSVQAFIMFTFINKVVSQLHFLVYSEFIAYTFLNHKLPDHIANNAINNLINNCFPSHNLHFHNINFPINDLFAMTN